MFKAPWRALSALALLTAIGCGDDGGSEPEGSISVSGSPTTLSVPQGGTGTVTVTLTRGGGFAEPVNVTVEGLPTGVTASVAPTSLTGTTTQAVVTVTVANSVAAGTYTATIRASAAGIGAATTTFALTVTAQGTYTLTATAASAVQGASGTSTIAIQRTNFTGPVTLTLENPPAGITGSFNPTPATGDQSVLTINVASTVAPGPYNLTVKGAATGPGDKTTTVALTVTAAPTSNYTLSVTPTTLNINPGGSGQATVNIARTNFDGTVTLSLDAPPAGITATFNPAAATGVTSLATINVAANVAPGNHTLTIKGTATGVADKTTTLTVTVAAGGTFTISAAPTALTIAPGANSSSNITIVRTNLTSDVALTLVNPPAGITGTFTPATLTGTTLTSALQINVAANVAPGAYPVTVQGVGGSVTQTTTVNVTVAAAGSTVTLAVAPTTLSIQAGSSGQTTLTATRTNFTGNITPSVSGNPAGMTVAFNPTPITANTSTVTVNVGAGVAPGTYNLTITGAAGTAGNPTTTLGVTVTAAGGGQNIVWEFCNVDGVPLKFWRQSGGTWAEVSPTVVGAVTRFAFTISGTQGGIAYTTSVTGADVRNSLRSAAPGTFGPLGRPLRQKLISTGARLTNQTGELLSSYFDTFVMFALTSEMSSRQQVCTTPNPPAPVTKTFTVSGMGSSEVGSLGYGDGSASLVPATTTYNVSVTPGTYDWLAAFGTAGGAPFFTPTWTHYRLGRGETAPGGTVAINRTGATAFTTMPFTITGAAAGSFNFYVQNLEGARGSINALTFGDPTANSGNLLFLAPGDRLPTDMNSFFVTNGEIGTTTQSLRGSFRFFGPNPPASATFALPAAVPAFTVAAVNGAPVPTWSATGQIPSEYQGANSQVEASFQGAGESTLYTIIATRGWLTANNMSTSFTLTAPTLPGFLAQWAPAAPLVDAQVAMYSDFNLFGTAGAVISFAVRLVASP